MEGLQVAPKHVWEIDRIGRKGIRQSHRAFADGSQIFIETRYDVYGTISKTKVGLSRADAIALADAIRAHFGEVE